VPKRQKTQTAVSISRCVIGNVNDKIFAGTLRPKKKPLIKRLLFFWSYEKWLQPLS